MTADSKNVRVFVGDKVLFLGQMYTIKAILPGKGRWGSDAFEFKEPVHVTEVPDEASIDKLRGRINSRD